MAEVLKYRQELNKIANLRQSCIRKMWRANILGVVIAFISIFAYAITGLPVLAPIGLIVFFVFGAIGLIESTKHGTLNCPRCKQPFSKPLKSYWFGLKGRCPPVYVASPDCQCCGLSLGILSRPVNDTSKAWKNDL